MNDFWERLAAELLSNPHGRALFADARRLSGGDAEVGASLTALRLRQGRPCDDAIRAMILRARCSPERNRLAD